MRFAHAERYSIVASWGVGMHLGRSGLDAGGCSDPMKNYSRSTSKSFMLKGHGKASCKLRQYRRSAEEPDVLVITTECPVATGEAAQRDKMRLLLVGRLINTPFQDITILRLSNITMSGYLRTAATHTSVR